MGERSEHAHLQNRLSDGVQFVYSFFGTVPLLTGCSTIKGDMQNQSSETVSEGRTGGSAKCLAGSESPFMIVASVTFIYSSIF